MLKEKDGKKDKNTYFKAKISRQQRQPLLSTVSTEKRAWESYGIPTHGFHPRILWAWHKQTQIKTFLNSPSKQELTEGAELENVHM